MPLYRYALVIAVVFMTACSDPPPPPPPVEVVIDSVTVEPYRRSNILVGRLQGYDDVHIKANVSGYLIERAFKEGDLVEKGDLLFRIDPARFKAELAGVNADLQRVEAAQKVASLNYDRGLELKPKGYISASEMDALTSSKLQADANLEVAQAELESAQVNLGYTRITAPISGRIGRSQVSPGDLIGADSGELTTLVATDPIKVLFQVSESVYLNAIGKLHSVQDYETLINALTVTLELSNGELYPEPGHLDYIANRIDEKTGTIEARALVPNHDGLLKPGQYVKAIVKTINATDVLMVPQAAIQNDQQGEFALAVDSSGTVGRRNVVLGDRVADKVVVKQGLREGDNVIVRGLQRVRDGQQVSAKHMQQPSAAAAGTP